MAFEIPFAVGNGFDVHRFREGGVLKLCGVEVPYTKSLLAHSDGDVALHALCDALLGAAALRDIGYHFPPSDDRYKDIDSGVLLQRVAILVADAGWMPANVDVTIMAEQPRIKPYVEAMRTRIAELLGGETVVSVKATTCEGLGFVGREEGIAAMASVLLYRKKDLKEWI